MTQDSDHQPSSSSKRSARAGRNRPMLVTSQEVEGTEQASIEEATPTIEENVVESAPTAPAKRRMPAFFSTVGKRAQTAESQEIDPAQARIARATRGKAAPAKASDEEKKPEVKKEPVASKSAASSRPPSIFKTKYLIGMGLYLLAANFIGIFETQFMRAYNLDFVLTQFTLFGSKIVISTSTVVFLLTLVIILVLLARFDLIPRNFGALMGGNSSSHQNKRGGGSSNQGSNDGTKNTPPTMKQGIKGDHDDLYQVYRSNQKRTKKK
ncbi:MAG TPA: hypothetical protein VIY29_28825 [Ktedonobacteraceae bacterium]